MSIRLLQGENWRQTWEWGVLPWVRQLGLPTGKPDLILLPHYAAVAYLKRRIALAGLGTLGLHYFTPGQMRHWLLARKFPGKKLIVREDLAFLLAAHAETFTQDTEAASITQDPSPLLCDLDRLLAAGWTWLDLPEGIGKVIVQKTLASKNAAGWWTTSEADWKLRENDGPPLCRRLLAVGFTARNWPLWSLLQAAVQSAEESTLLTPPWTDEPLGQLWQATLEETWNEAEPLIPPKDAFPCPEPTIQERRFFRYAVKPTWFSSADPMSESRAACGWALSQASSSNQTKTLLFPPGSPTARAISLQLSSWAIPHHDTFGHQPASGPLEQQWKAWLHWQEHPQLDHWLEWAEICREHAVNSTEISVWCERMKRAAQELLHPEVSTLQAWIRREPKYTDVAPNWLEQWPPLPERDTALNYLKQSIIVLRRIGWADRADFLEKDYTGIFTTLEKPVQRETFISWLRERLQAPGRMRTGEGRETLANLQLLSYPEAEILPGGYFYCGGLTAGCWPPPIRETGMWPPAWFKTKNEAALQESRFGGGQKVLRPGNGYILGSEDLQRLQRQGLAWILAEAGIDGRETDQVVLSYAEKQDLQQEEIEGASELFLKTWYDWHECLPSASNLEQMRAQARQREHICLTLEKTKIQTIPQNSLMEVANCQLAWQARRDPKLALDHYSYCFREPAPPLADWTGRDWEQYWAQPALAWLIRLLGLHPREESEELISPPRWRARKLHAWTGWKERGQFLALPAQTEWIAYSYQCALREFQLLQDFWRRRGRDVPLIAACLWNETKEEARACLELLFELADSDLNNKYTWVASQPITEINRQAEIPVTGQVDLILAKKSADLQDSRPWQSLLLVAFTTNAPGQWYSQQILDKGHGLRLIVPGLYYWMPLTHKLQVVIISAEKAGSCKDLAELPIKEIHARLAMARRGIFGPSEVMNSRFQFTGRYPLACLPIPAETVRTKRELVMAYP